MEQTLLQILYASLGSYGFALLFNQKPFSRALPSAFGGALSWGIYLLCSHFGTDVFFAGLAGGFVSCLFAEIMARLLKAPTTVFVTAAVIPLIPGGSLYYTMSSAIERNAESFRYYGSATLYTALGIAVGIALVTAAIHMISGTSARTRKKAARKAPSSR